MKVTLHDITKGVQIRFCINKTQLEGKVHIKQNETISGTLGVKAQCDCFRQKENTKINEKVKAEENYGNSFEGKYERWEAKRTNLTLYQQLNQLKGV